MDSISTFNQILLATDRLAQGFALARFLI